jgi:hypothetical protein
VIEFTIFHAQALLIGFPFGIAVVGILLRNK